MAVYAKFYGRTGNQLFQRAAAIGYATKHGLPYFEKDVPYALRILLKEHGHNYQPLPYLPEWRNKNILLDGYWQSARYFDHCREEVLKAFGYDWSLKEGWCSIHVRRGDYLLYPDKHPVVTGEYLQRAIQYIYKHTVVDKFMVFSDDIPYCKTIFNVLEYCGFTFEYSEGRTAEEDLILGSCCEHNIISNSTFSWWQGYLNQNPDKVVISPSKDNWFGPGNKHLNTSDLIPESWIQIKY